MAITNLEYREIDNLYLITWDGGIAPFIIYIDDVNVDEVLNNNYNFMIIEPGLHTIKVIDNVDSEIEIVINVPLINIFEPDYTDNKAVKLYRLLKVYDLNPYYYGTHPDGVNSGEQYTVIKTGETVSGKNKRYIDIEIVLTTKVESNPTNNAITNISKHMETEQLIKNVLKIENNDVLKQSILGDIKRIKYLGDIPLVRLEENDTWVSSLLFRIFDIGSNT